MSAARRAATLEAMYRGAKRGLGTRRMDNCFEMGDGDRVQAILRDKIAADASLARAIVHGTAYGCGYPEPGAPDYGNPVWRYVNYQLLAVALDTLHEAAPAYWGADTAARIDEARAKLAARVEPQLELAL